jgi:hypothetical protein
MAELTAKRLLTVAEYIEHERTASEKSIFPKVRNTLAKGPIGVDEHTFVQSNRPVSFSFPV